MKRRAGEKFRELPKGGSAEAVEAAFRRGCEELEVVKRQAVVYKLYARKQKSVMVRGVGWGGVGRGVRVGACNEGLVLHEAVVWSAHGQRYSRRRRWS